MTSKLTRRELLASAALTSGALALNQVSRAIAQTVSPTTSEAERADLAPGAALQSGGFRPVIVPNGATLPSKVVDGVRVFHLIAEPVEHEFAPGLKASCWGYNGRTPGPVIEALEGERVRIYVTNRLPEPTSAHWHGLFLPNGMDGVSGLTQKPIPMGVTFKYEFNLSRAGTFMYHPHFDEMTQMALGLMGMFVVHPRAPRGRLPDRDFSLMLSEWQVIPGTSRPNPSAMTDFNVLTFNAKAFPGTEPLLVKQGDLVRIRFGNLSAMDHHPIHIHGHAFILTATDGGDVPESARYPETTVLVPTGTTRVVEFVADAPGDWAMHCHMTHHIMNQMGHGLPNLVGIDTTGLDQKMREVLPDYMTMGESGMGGHAQHAQMMGVPKNSLPMGGGEGPFSYIDMGGMFTILKVRESLDRADDIGWYSHPSGSVAERASTAELVKDGIKN